MKSLFVGLCALTLTAFFATGLMAQIAPPTAAGQKAIAARIKQKDDAAKGKAPAIAAEAKLAAEAKVLAPAVVAGLKLPCTVADARHDTAYDGKVVLELACSEGLGYMTVSAADGSAGAAVDCIPNPKTPQPGTGCRLPANSKENAVKSLQPYLKTANSDCTVTNAQTLGQTATAVVYEVACSDGHGEVMQLTLPRTAASRSLSQGCLRMGTVSGIACSLTTAEGNAAPVRALAAKAGRPCTVNKERYVAATPQGSDIYELGCTEGNGFMVVANTRGEYERTMTCVQAAGIGGGCTFTDAAPAIAAQLTTYSNMVKAQTFDCTVSKFASFPIRQGTTASEVIEVGCSNRPDSVVAIINGDKAEVMNCARARVDGYGCTYTKPEDALKLLTADLKTTRFQTCEVNGQRGMGTSTRNAFIEVTCADGNPGFVLTYPLGSGKPSEATPCGLATSLGGGCQMPANKRS